MPKKPKQEVLQAQGAQYEKMIQAMGGSHYIHYLLAKIGFIKALHSQTEPGYMISDDDIATAELLNEHFMQMEQLKDI